MKICQDIRFMEAAYKMPPNVNFEDDLIDRALCDKQSREEALAKQLYIWVKEYALKDNYNDRHNIFRY